MEENQNKAPEKPEKNSSGEEKPGKEAKRGGIRRRLQQTPTFALTDEEQDAAAEAEVAPENGSAENEPEETAEKKDARRQEKKKRLIDRPSPFALGPDDLPQDTGGEDLDAQLQFQESQAKIELPMDRELEEEENNPSARPKPPQKKHRRRWYGIPMGALVLCLALVGLIFLGKQAYNYIYARVTDDSSERAYDTYLSPVVMLDPEPFESLDAANKDMMLQAAVWKTVAENASKTNNYDDNARMVFSGELVRSNAVKLFGVNCILTQTDIYLPGSGKDKGTPEGTIAYDEATDTYHVPLIANVGTYQPYTVSVHNKGDVATLKVAYCVPADNIASTMPTASQTSEAAAADQSEIIKAQSGNLRVVKYMEYEISYDEDTKLQYISAIRSISQS